MSTPKGAGKHPFFNSVAPNQIVMAPFHPYIASTSKKRERIMISDRVREVGHATFTPLVLSTTGEMGRAATFYKRLASMVAEKRDAPYAVTLNWIRCQLNFALLRGSIMSMYQGSEIIPTPAAAECPSACGRPPQLTLWLLTCIPLFCMPFIPLYFSFIFPLLGRA